MGQKGSNVSSETGGEKSKRLKTSCSEKNLWVDCSSETEKNSRRKESKEFKVVDSFMMPLRETKKIEKFEKI